MVRRRRAGRPGPKPSITLDVVKRVSDRVGRGLTLALALAAECCATINVETWKKCLQAHPEFSPHYEAGKGRFLDAAVKRLAESHELKYLCWLLERRHGDLFSKPDAPAAVVNVITAIPEDVVQRAREISRADLDLVAVKKPHG